ncbi:sensor histidine kinase [Phaeobacter sp.]|uniref:sensor histidine kinase n=1 Tax=Phaeobacter sp. TaxID=1902409 RepID=UPI0025E6046D|nr:sensor histidine kinase [Phaeobacter sp.]
MFRSLRILLSNGRFLACLGLAALAVLMGIVLAAPSHAVITVFLVLAVPLAGMLLLLGQILMTGPSPGVKPPSGPAGARDATVSATRADQAQNTMPDDMMPDDAMLEDAMPDHTVADDTEAETQQLIAALQQAQQQIERDSREKTDLLREVNHRVKNNLQLIVSIMNMQARDVRTPEAMAVLAQLQRRVRGLAAVYRTVAPRPDDTSIDAAELIDGLSRELAAVSHVQMATLEVDTDAEAAALDQEQAVNLSMLLAEAITYLTALAQPAADGAVSLSISFARRSSGAGAEPDDLVLTFCAMAQGEGNPDTPVSDTPVSATQVSDFPPPDLEGRLMRAFVQQLNGHEQIETRAGQVTYEVVFPAASL